ncbi:MAG: protein-ADP-ribose hydrolase [Clostridia bacterium]|nr:protein-ADP-ribose hydrolase [Clostridia bacterium]
MNQRERREALIRALLNENPDLRDLRIPGDEAERKTLLRGLMNIRPPMAADPAFLTLQGEYLREESNERGVVRVAELSPVRPGLYLWQGDITRLQCDAIVNAANSGMTGCYVPNHRCIDNAIHTYAGVELRLACEELMRRQGHPEPTGQAKITPAFHLPSKYILHTVGPIVRGKVTEQDKRSLASCYRACLELAAEHGLESVAFCCISTGEFGFPNEPAAEIAVETVGSFLTGNTSIGKVIFNVFKDKDREIYERLLAN